MSIIDNSDNKFYLSFSENTLIQFNSEEREFFTEKTFKELVDDAFNKNLAYTVGLILKSDRSFAIFDGIQLCKNHKRIPNSKKHFLNKRDYNTLTRHFSDGVFYFTIKKTEQIYGNIFLPLEKCTEEVKEDQDETLALKWYGQAADQGNITAQFYLGVCYSKGLGVKKDEFLAFKWFRLAAEQGGIEAQYNVGVFYEGGKGVKKDEVLAFKWYRLAAEQGSAEAQYNVGVCYANGMGVKKDEVLAFKWYKLAAEQGDRLA